MATKQTGNPLLDNQLAKLVTASAQQIWNAGLGAMALAEKEGNKVFDTLSALGQMLHEGTRDGVKGKVEQTGATASSVKETASGTWDKLELIFQDRVARALNALQIPTAADVQGLSKRVEELQEAVRKLTAAQASRAAPKRKKTAARKPAKKKAAKKKAAKKRAVKKTAAAKSAWAESRRGGPSGSDSAAG